MQCDLRDIQGISEEYSNRSGARVTINRGQQCPTCNLQADWMADQRDQKGPIFNNWLI